jgi:hypothetical protein
MTILERPERSPAEGMGPDCPELLFPEARQRRRRRWLLGGVIVVVACIVGVSLVNEVTGQGERRPSSPSGALSPLHRLLAAVRHTNAAGTAAINVTTTIENHTDPTAVRTEVGHVRFKGPDAMVGLQISPPGLVSSAPSAVEYLGKVGYYLSGSRWSTGPSAMAFPVFGALRPSTLIRSKVVVVGTYGSGAGRAEEFRVDQPGYVVQRFGNARLVAQSYRVLVWIDVHQRIIRSETSSVVTTESLPYSTLRSDPTTQSIDETLSSFGVAFEPSAEPNVVGRNAFRCGYYPNMGIVGAC